MCLKRLPRFSETPRAHRAPVTGKLNDEIDTQVVRSLETRITMAQESRITQLGRKEGLALERRYAIPTKAPRQHLPRNDGRYSLPDEHFLRDGIDQPKGIVAIMAVDVLGFRSCPLCSEGDIMGIRSRVQSLSRTLGLLEDLKSPIGDSVTNARGEDPAVLLGKTSIPAGKE